MIIRKANKDEAAQIAELFLLAWPVGLIVDIDKPQAEALYARLGFIHIGYKEFFGHQMKHMVKAL